MIFTPQLMLRLSAHLMKNGLLRRKKFPFVLMLEPLLRCNLACAGCGRIREYHDVLDQNMSVEECLQSVDECGAPVICLTGGEPLLHPQIYDIVDGILARKRVLFLSSNGLLVKSSLPRLRPSPYLSFVIHMDGLAQTHDRITNRDGMFQTALDAIRAAKAAGFQVRTNTTIYKGTDPAEVSQLFRLLTDNGVDGIMVSPAFSYDAVADSSMFLTKEEFRDLFRFVDDGGNGVRFFNTPVYRRFLTGDLPLMCAPWSSPTRNPKGWKQPCYLITDSHCNSYSELMHETDWDKYGVGNDPRCANCMVHCGFEAPGILWARNRPVELWRMLRWNLS